MGRDESDVVVSPQFRRRGRENVGTRWAGLTPSGMDIVPQPQTGDAFGEALLAQLGGAHPGGRGEDRADIIYERDDGLVNADSSEYFLDEKLWHELDRWALEYVRGRVLDFGAGGGRASLALQKRKFDVVALDVSPGAIETCRRRGVRETFLGEITELATDPSQKFDSFLALGNNLGLLGSPDQAARMFNAFSALANPGASIVGTCLDPTAGEPPPWHGSYHDRNRAAGLPPGQIKLRTRFRNITTEWFDLLWTSPEELDELAMRSGWEVAQVRPGPLYGAILVRLES